MACWASVHTDRLQQRLDTIRREKMDFADRADIATRLCAEEIPHDVADHAGYIADEVNLLAAQRTYELDHYYPRSTHPELTDDPANFRAAHSNCNRSRGKGTAVYALG